MHLRLAAVVMCCAATGGHGFWTSAMEDGHSPEKSQQAATVKQEIPTVPAKTKPTRPIVELSDWKPVFEKHPEYFDHGVYVVEIPEKAIVVTAGLPLESLGMKTDEDRDMAEKSVALVANRELFRYFYERDKQGLRFPQHLQKFADDSVRFNAYQRTMTVVGMQRAAVWSDDKSLWCTVIVAEGNVKLAKDFVRQIGIVGVQHYLDDFRKTKSIADLYRAFEFNPESKDVRAELVKEFSVRGQRVAAYVVQDATAKLPLPDEPLARFLQSTENPAWREGMEHFQAKTPDLERASAALLRSLDFRYADPDAFNYIGVCYRKLGYPRLASLFLGRALEQSPKQVHRYVLTNLGLCLMEAGQREEARSRLLKAVAEFPDEPWTEYARKALVELDTPPPCKEPGDMPHVPAKPGESKSNGSQHVPETKFDSKPKPEGVRAVEPKPVRPPGEVSSPDP
ncbi:MAG: tetratricopeptide repeat protein [Planctomycetota bacterium]